MWILLSLVILFAILTFATFYCLGEKFVDLRISDKIIAMSEDGSKVTIKYSAADNVIFNICFSGCPSDYTRDAKKQIRNHIRNKISKLKSEDMIGAKKQDVERNLSQIIGDDFCQNQCETAPVIELKPFADKIR